MQENVETKLGILFEKETIKLSKCEVLLKKWLFTCERNKNVKTVLKSFIHLETKALSRSHTHNITQQERKKMAEESHNVTEVITYLQ